MKKVFLSKLLDGFTVMLSRISRESKSKCTVDCMDYARDNRNGMSYFQRGIIVHLQLQLLKVLCGAVSTFVFLLTALVPIAFQ